jgi:hypothetical protein
MLQRAIFRRKASAFGFAFAAAFVAALAVSANAYADFSYTSTQRTTGGSLGAMAGTGADRVRKYYFKGQKMMYSSGDAATIMDFGTQTVTTLNSATKTYTVKKFGEMLEPGAKAAVSNVDIRADVKETGRKKVVNGFDASETIVTMDIDMETGRGPAMKIEMEMDMWVSRDVPGAGEMRAFYKNNAANFPWAAMLGGNGNQSMQKAMTEMQRKLAEVDGAVVEQVIRIRPAGGAQMPQMPALTPAQQAQMQASKAKMQEMAKQGGPGAAAAQQALSAMNAMAGGGAGASNSLMEQTLLEQTMDSSGFSSASIPESLFAVPAGYKVSK